MSFLFSPCLPSVPLLSVQQIGRAQVLTFDTSVLVEEKDVKGAKIIRIQQIGSRKEHCLRFEVNLAKVYSPSCFTDYTIHCCISPPPPLPLPPFPFPFPSFPPLSLLSNSQSRFEQEIWLDYLKQSVLKSEALLHAGPKMMRDNTSVVSVHLRERRALHQTTSLPAIRQE